MCQRSNWHHCFVFHVFQNVIFVDHLSLISPPLFENMWVHCPSPIPSHYLEISLKKSYRHRTSNFPALIWLWNMFSFGKLICKSTQKTTGMWNLILFVEKVSPGKQRPSISPHTQLVWYIFTHHWPYRNQPSVGKYFTLRIQTPN